LIVFKAELPDIALVAVSVFFICIVSFFVKNLSCGGALRAISWQISGRFRSHVRHQYTPAHPP